MAKARCPDCGENDPSKFGKNKAMESGLCCYCKSCMNNRNRKSRFDNPEKVQEHKRKWIAKNPDYYLDQYAKNKDRFSNKNAKYREKNPEKIKAHNTIIKAIKNGILKREPCVICGNERVDNHHESYKEENWGKVIPLCRLHHRRRHVEIENGIPLDEEKYKITDMNRIS